MVWWIRVPQPHTFIPYIVSLSLFLDHTKCQTRIRSGKGGVRCKYEFEAPWVIIPIAPNHSWSHSHDTQVNGIFVWFILTTSQFLLMANLMVATPYVCIFSQHMLLFCCPSIYMCSHFPPPNLIHLCACTLSLEQQAIKMSESLTWGREVTNSSQLECFKLIWGVVGVGLPFGLQHRSLQFKWM